MASIDALHTYVTDEYAALRRRITRKKLWHNGSFTFADGAMLVREAPEGAAVKARFLKLNEAELGRTLGCLIGRRNEVDAASKPTK